MLTMVSAQSSGGDTLLLPLMDSSGGYIVKDIQGLDPVKATLVSTAFAQLDGAQLHNARRETRNIVMKLGLEPDYISNNVASLRTDLYKFFMPKSMITFSLYADDVLWGTTETVVETCDNNMFSADPEVDISLICYDPDFYAPDPVTLSSSTVSSSTTTEIDYEGTSDTGILFTITFPGPYSGISLYNRRPDMITDTIDLSASFLAGDVLEINSNPLSKGVTIIRSGLRIPSLYSLNYPQSSWISLKQGSNLFRAYLPGASIPFSLEYTPKYGGF
jgi:hypothetical protein